MLYFVWGSYHNFSYRVRNLNFFTIEFMIMAISYPYLGFVGSAFSWTFLFASCVVGLSVGVPSKSVSYIWQGSINTGN